MTSSSMRRSSASFLLLMTICCFFLAAHAHARPPLGARPASTKNNLTANCIPKERDALLDFKEGINDTSNLLVSWQEGRDCCRWLGVTCCHQTGNVLRLELSSDTTLLDGSLEGQQISPSLLSLEHLEYLDLSGINPSRDSGPNSSSPEFLGSMKNLRHLDLSGGLLFYGGIPPQLSDLSKLEYLDLSWASFNGRVPPELSNLTNLQHLDLGGMQDLYSTDISWLSHLHLLEYLDLSYMNLSMSTDWPHVPNSSPSLKVLNLAKCNLPQANQALAHLNLTDIVQLDLSSNYLGNPVSSFWFWNVTTLESLELSETHLFGPFPSALGSLTSLQFLGFNDNGNGATMLVDLKDLSALQHLHLRGSLSGGNINDLIERLPRGSTRDMQANSSLYNLDLSKNHLTGTIPPDVPNIIPGLEILDLSANNLTGAIPQAIRNCSNLWDLTLRSNQLSGQIPILPKNISRLDLSMNQFSGPLPLQLWSPNLQTLILSSNHITGQIPQSICETQNSMTLLDLSDNFLDGTFPQCHKMPYMIFLLLNHNNFSGSLPSFLRSTILVYMDLSWNSFYGTLPLWIGEMVNLVFLRLSHNMFYGHIPVNITNLTSLRYLDLAGNNISGTIPGSLSKLTAMTGKHVKLIDWFDYYSEPDTDGLRPFGGIFSVVIKRQERNYGDRVYEVVGIDLSLNHLTGGIPDDITSLKRLLTLNLSWNQLSGKILENIGVIKSLESLDLSWNKLSGEIPPSLADLTYLSNLDLSHNNLTGRIPQGRQLDTLYTEDPSMYDGNNGLCGPPLEKGCSSSKLPENGNQKIGKQHSDVRFFYVGLGSGFMAGLWVVFCVILFKRTWRIAYFHLFDRVYDEVYVFVILTWGKLARNSTTDS